MNSTPAITVSSLTPAITVSSLGIAVATPIESDNTFDNKPKKKSTNGSGKSYLHLILEAIEQTRNGRGASSRLRIKQYVFDKRAAATGSSIPAFRAALKRGVETGVLRQVNQSYAIVAKKNKKKNKKQSGASSKRTSQKTNKSTKKSTNASAIRKSKPTKKKKIKRSKKVVAPIDISLSSTESDTNSD